MKTLPFSLYDFIGYFIPGALLLYCIFITNFLFNSDVESLYKLLLNVESLNKLNLESILFFIIISYCLGFIISLISSITIEKLAERHFGYPSTYLLNDNVEKIAENKFEIVYRFFIFLFIFPIFIISKVFKVLLPEKLTKPLKPILIVSIKESIYNFLFDKKIINRNTHEETLTKINKIKTLINNEDFVSAISKLKDIVLKFDYFRLIQHHTYEIKSNHQVKYNNYVALYGFARTISLVMIINLWYIIFKSTFIIECNQLTFHFSFNCSIFLIFIINLCFSILFYMGFFKFYRKFTLEGLMLLLIDTNTINNSANK